MKRFFFAWALLLAASSATAQQTTIVDAGCKFRYDQPLTRPIAAMLEAWATQCGYTIDYEPDDYAPGGQITFSGEFPTLASAVAAASSLGKIQATVNDATKVIRISPLTTTVTPPPTVPPSIPRHEGITTPREIVESMINRYPQAFDRGGNIGSFNQLYAMQQEIGALRTAPPDLYVNAHVYAQDSFFYGGNFYDPRYAGTYYPEAMRRYRNRGMVGGLKTQGETKGVDVYLRGCFIAAANQIDGKFDQKVPMVAGEAVTLTVVRLEDFQSYDWVIRAPSQAENEVVGARHMTLRIDDAYFNSGTPFDRQKAAKECTSASR
jgi:hypothetical protein